MSTRYQTRERPGVERAVAEMERAALRQRRGEIKREREEAFVRAVEEWELDNPGPDARMERP